MNAQRAGQTAEAIRLFNQVALAAADSDPRTATMARQWVDYLQYGHQAYAFDGKTGAKLWKSGFDIFKGVTDGLAVVNGNVYFLNIDGYLYDFGL